MDGKRLGFVGIVIEERAMAAKVNEILSAFGGIIRGRLGNLPGVTVKSALVSQKTKTER